MTNNKLSVRLIVDRGRELKGIYPKTSCSPAEVLLMDWFGSNSDTKSSRINKAILYNCEFTTNSSIDGYK